VTSSRWRTEINCSVHNCTWSSNTCSTCSTVVMFLLLLYVDDETVSEKQANGFVSSKRTQLSEMFCFISTPSVGYMYSIGSSFHLVSTYHYATVVTQVSFLCVCTFSALSTRSVVQDCWLGHRKGCSSYTSSNQKFQLRKFKNYRIGL